MSDIKESVKKLILLTQNKEKKVDDSHFLHTAYLNNVPAMIKSLAVYHFENEGDVEGDDEDWKNVRLGLLNLRNHGLYSVQPNPKPKNQ